MLGAAGAAPSLSALRNLCIMQLMVHTGLRASELRGLTVDQIDWSTGKFKVRGKGGRERVLWIAAPDLFLLRRWLAARGCKVPSGNYEVPSGNWLFTTLDGQRPICSRWLRTMVKREAVKAGIKKDIHPHSLRHSFASNLLRQEKNLFLVSKCLGHADLSTTQIYLHLEDEELEKAMLRLGNGG